MTAAASPCLRVLEEVRSEDFTVSPTGELKTFETSFEKSFFLS